MPTDFGNAVQSDTAIADSFMVGRPEMLQDPYRAASERYPVSPTAPRYQVPIEEQMRLQEWQTQQLGRQTAIQGQLTNQRIAQEEFRYQSNMNKQTEEALSQDVLSQFDPAQPDYPAQKAAFAKQYPLAAQNPYFQRLFSGMDNVHEISMRADQTLQRDASEQDFRQQFAEDRQEQDMLMELAKYGPQAISAYQSNLKPDPQTKLIGPAQRLQAFAAANSVVQQERNRQLEEKPMTPQQVQKARIDLIGAKNRVLERRKDPNYEWTSDDQADLDAIQSEIRSLSDNPSNTQASPAPASKTAPPSSFFPKPSTKAGP